MATFWAAYPHPAGVFQSIDKRIVGTTREEVLKKARAECPVGRYLSSIWTEDGRKMLWQESSGWTAAADQHLSA